MGKQSINVLAIDEAGRGPVIGSLFIAGVIIDESKAEKFSSDGVRDSKKMSPEKRDFFFSKIKEEAVKVYCVEVTASEIDYKRKKISLNELEAEKMARVIEQALEEGIRFDKLILDVPDPTGKQFVDRIKRYVDLPEGLEIIAEHGADDTYPACSVASVIAKVNRDRSVRRIEEEFGLDLNSGYPHESKVIDYMKRVIREKGEYPDFVRESWATAERIRGEVVQRKIGDY